MTNKFMFDESSQALHRVVGTAQPWEHLSPGIRVRRRTVTPLELHRPHGVAQWVSRLGFDFDGHRNKGEPSR